MKLILQTVLCLCMSSFTLIVPAHAMDETQMDNIQRLQASCSSVAEAVMESKQAEPFNIDLCVRAFQQSAQYYVEKLVANDVGYAQGCQIAIQSLSTDNTVNSVLANDIAQKGWTCLATYASPPASVEVFQDLGFDLAAYEATTVIPYCISAASGEIEGEALQTERQGCINGIRRHRLLVKERDL